MFFPSSRPGGSKGVAIRGQSRKEETKEQFLERTRLEREQRKRQRQEIKAATTIQAHYRSWRVRTQMLREQQEAWCSSMAGGSMPALSILVSEPLLVTRLLFFLDCRHEEHVVLLAALARLIVVNAKLPEVASLWQGFGQPAQRSQVLVRLRGLALACLQALHLHRHAFMSVLAEPKANASTGQASPAPAMLDCLLLLAAPETYAAALGKPEAMQLSASIVRHLAGHGLFTMLRQLLSDVVASGPASSTPAGRPSMAAALVQQLSVRALMLKGWVPNSPTDAPHALLFVPGLWARCGPAMQLAAPRLLQASLVHLAPWACAGHLVELLPQDASGGMAGAVTALLGNLLTEGHKLLVVPAATAAAQQSSIAGQAAAAAQAPAAGQVREAALRLTKVLCAAVELLPLQPFFGAAANRSDDGSAETDSLSGTQRLTFPTCYTPLPEMQSVVQLLTSLTGMPLLRHLVPVLLPHTRDSPLSWDPQWGHESLTALQGACESAYSLCALVEALAVLPQQHQPVMLTLVISADIVERLWWSFLRAARAAQLADVELFPPELTGPAAVLASSSSGSFASASRPSIPALGSGSANYSRGGAAGEDASKSSLAIGRASGYDSGTMGGSSPIFGSSPSSGSYMASYMDIDRPSSSRAAKSAADASTASTSVPLAGTSLSSPMAVRIAATPSLLLTGSSPGSRLGPGITSLSPKDHARLAALAARVRSEKWSPLEDDPGWMLPLLVLCEAFSAHIMTSSLDEFDVQQRPIALEQLYSAKAPSMGLLATLRDALWQVLWIDAERPTRGAAAMTAGRSTSASCNAALTSATSCSDVLRAALAESCGELYAQLCERNARKAFCPSDVFHAPSLAAAPERFYIEATASGVLPNMREGAGTDGGGDHAIADGWAASAGQGAGAGAGQEDGGRVWRVLRYAPVLVPFEERARLFQGMVAEERERYREMEHSRSFEMAMMHGSAPHRFVQIRRSQLLYDGFDRLNTLGEGLKGRVRVSFVDQHGAPEAGVDGGGLFKDFMEELMKQGFSPQYGLFQANASQELYPNPSALGVVEEAPRLLEFLGRMLGKALYEGILLELPLAGFFLKKFRGAHCGLNDLPTLDPQLHSNLLKLRHHDGDVADLALTFALTETVFGVHREVELKPGGRHIPVTSDNVMEYIHRVAQYKLNIAPRAAVTSFLRGFFELIPQSWVRMFSGAELQMLISGSEEGIDLQDLQQHVEYAGGYHPEHPVIITLWEVLADFTADEQRALLRFVTACSRAPLLGFKYLEPHLCIQMAGSVLDPSCYERLPTAATCMNLLKLPPYSSYQQMRDKLLYAVRSGAGFDLS